MFVRPLLDNSFWSVITSQCLFVFLFVCLFVCLFVWFCLFGFVCLFVCLFLFGFHVFFCQRSQCLSSSSRIRSGGRRAAAAAADAEANFEVKKEFESVSDIVNLVKKLADHLKNNNWKIGSLQAKRDSLMIKEKAKEITGLI